MKCEHPNKIALVDRDIDYIIAWYCPDCKDLRMVAAFDSGRRRRMAERMVREMSEARCQPYDEGKTR